MHVARPIEDNRKSVKKKGVSGIVGVPFPQMELYTNLGLWVRTVLWSDVDDLLYANGGPSVGYTRNFAEAGITEENMVFLVEKRFPGFRENGNAIIRSHENYTGAREQSVDYKSYRYIWSGFRDASKKDPKEKFGPENGKRHWKNNVKMRNLMPTICNLKLKIGPRLQFHYDIHNPRQVPVPR